MSFDRLAPVYRSMERVLAGDKLQRCRLAYLPQLGAIRQALLLGEGHGRFLVSLLQANPIVRVTLVDSSAGMIQQAKHALRQAQIAEARVDFIHADALQWPGMEARFDLISTHFFLDCFNAEQLRVLLPKLAHCASPEALWVVSDFCAPATGLARIRARLILWSMYRFFRVVTRLPASDLVDYTETLQQLGFHLAQRQTFEWGLLRADLWRAGKD